MAFIETTQDGRPLYVVRWNYRDKTLDGKPYDQRTFRNRREAKAWDKQVAPQDSSRAQRVTIAHVAEAWLERHVATLEEATRDGYRTQVKLRIRPLLGSKRVERLTAADVAKWMRDMQDAGCSPATCNKTLRAFKAMLRWARAEGITTCRAADDTRGFVDHSEHEARAYTPEELNRIVGACRLLQDATIMQVAAYSGLRKSELFALHWDQVSLAGSEIRVTRALSPSGKIKTPKSHERRAVPLLAPGVEALKSWFITSTDRTGLVFATQRGTPLGRNWQRDSLGEIPGDPPGPDATPGQRRAYQAKVTRWPQSIRGVSGIHVQMHELRDTYASLLLATGSSAEELKLAMGHKSIQTTLDHYVVWLEPSRVLLAERANAGLERLGYV